VIHTLKSMLFILLVGLIPASIAVAQSDQSPATKPGPVGKALSAVKDTAEDMRDRYRLRSPAVMERKWRQYQRRMDRDYIQRSPRNRESSLEYMLREFW
jgi:hypothetical protein